MGYLFTFYDQILTHDYKNEFEIPFRRLTQHKSSVFLKYHVSFRTWETSLPMTDSDRGPTSYRRLRTTGVLTCTPEKHILGTVGGLPFSSGSGQYVSKVKFIYLYRFWRYQQKSITGCPIKEKREHHIRTPFGYTLVLLLELQYTSNNTVAIMYFGISHFV